VPVETGNYDLYSLFIELHLGTSICFLIVGYVRLPYRSINRSRAPAQTISSLEAYSASQIPIWWEVTHCPSKNIYAIGPLFIYLLFFYTT